MLESIQLKLPAASGGESSIFKEENNYIRSLTPGQAPGNALAERFNFRKKIIKHKLKFHTESRG